MKKNIVLSICIILTVILLISSLSAQELFIPNDVYYYQPAATVFGSEAVWVNPAALARYKISSYQFVFDYDKDNFAKNWGSVLNREGLGMAYREIDNPDGENFKEYIFAMGFPVNRKINAGLSYRYFSGGPGYFDGLHLWNLGLEGRFNSTLKWGAVFSNIGRKIIDGERSNTEMRYSLAYRPKKVKLTLAADLILDTKTKIGNGRYVYHAEYSPSEGLYINAFYDSDKSYQIGIRTNLVNYFTGNKTNFVKDDGYTNSTFYMGATSKQQPSMIDSKKKD